MLQLNLKRESLIEPLREIFIPTATAIVYQRNNPHMILVGSSAKHGKPVLPGGKIDQKDMTSSCLEKCAASCMARELGEEINAVKFSLRLFAVTADCGRDVRKITVDMLRGSIAEQIVSDLPWNATVIGRYGVPDFLFLAEVDPDAVTCSEELRRLSWIDSRTVTAESLGAGHGQLVMQYAEALSICGRVGDPDRA